MATVNLIANDGCIMILANDCYTDGQYNAYSQFLVVVANGGWPTANVKIPLNWANDGSI